MKLRVLLAIALVGLGAAGCGLDWHIGTMLIARAPWQALAAAGDLPVERVVLDQPGAPDLVGWAADRKGSCGAVVLLHGRGANRLALVQRAKLLFDAGYSVVLFDLSGHGESGGAIQGFGYTEAQDAARIIAYARQRFPGQKLGAVGSSLGAAAFVFAAQQAPADADNVRPVDRLGQIGEPLMLLAGSTDPFIDRSQVQALHSAAAGSQLVWFEGAGHVDLLRYDQPRYRDAVLPFLATKLCRAAYG